MALQSDRVGISAMFSGDVADYYQRFRRGYPSAVIDEIVATFGLASSDTVIDLGCGTGQLALPLAQRVGLVLGVDPEADMLARARAASLDKELSNVVWALASDAELPRFGDLMAGRPVAAVTIGQALHWMDPPTLFRAVKPMVRPGGGVAVLANGTPLWLQDSDWSQALRGLLETWLQTTLTATCGTDAASHARYAEQLEAAGFTVSEATFDYVEELTADQIFGSLLSAGAANRLASPEARQAFTEQLTSVLPRLETYQEPVRVRMLFGLTTQPFLTGRMSV